MSVSIIETISAHISCRTYSHQAVETEKIANLAAYLKSNTDAPFGGNIRFELLNLDEMNLRELKTLGTYGVIRGARWFIAGAVKDQPKAMEDYGYAMEKNILLATSMGLGTCWLGGTFNRTGFTEKMNLAPDEFLPAVTPLGYPSDSCSFIDRMFRFSAGSDRRKPWEALFYDGNIEMPLSKASAGRHATPLECVRIGPSASNKQPWRIVRERDRFHFYVKRTPGYDRYFGPIKMQDIDMGIAMCHFELDSRETGLHGLWTAEDPRIESGDMEYIVSWIQRERDNPLRGSMSGNSGL